MTYLHQKIETEDFFILKLKAGSHVLVVKWSQPGGIIGLNFAAVHLLQQSVAN